MHNTMRKGFGNMTRFTLAFVFALGALLGTTGTSTVCAQEILLEGPLAGAPAVRQKIQYRKLRFSVGPQFGYTLLNDYMHSFLLGAKAEFNITDWLGVGVVGFFAFNAPTHLTKHISDSNNLAGDSTVPSDSNWPSYTGSHNFENQVARLKSMIIGQVALVPLRGKLAAFEKLFVAVDGYLFLGGGVVMFQERTHCSGNGCGDIEDFQAGGGTVTRELITKGVVSFGIGFTVYFNKFIGMNFEYRLAPFKWNAAGTDEAGQAGTQWVLHENPPDSDEPIIWDTTAEGSGDYPDGRITKKDQTWNANQSIIIGVVFNLPKNPKITE